MNRWTVALAIATAVTAAACSNETSPSPTGPTIACPVAQTVQSPDGRAVPVSFPPPTTSGGTAPVATTCVPASGSTFNVGSTAVTCTAQDARQQTAACTFTVTVSGPPHLSATSFVAFGDSITEGVLNPQCPTLSVALQPFDVRADERRLLEMSVNNPTSYPTKLQTLLTARYAAQAVAVINEGQAGEGVAGGLIRLPTVLAADRPQVLLLEEGINDIDANNPATITSTVSGLRQMIQQAKASGVQQVFVATFLPERAGACRGYRAGVIVPANDQIRAMVAGEGAQLSDIYAGFGGVASTDLIGFDGLHPTEAGYQLIAQTFFDAIRQRLETTKVRR